MRETFDPHQLCELRFDIPLALQGSAGPEAETRRFEQAWRTELAAQKKTALAMPPAQTVAARFRIVGPQVSPALHQYLQARLAALPGSPSVVPETDAVQSDWAGVQVWLSYPAGDLPMLLRSPQTKVNKKVNKKHVIQSRGHRL